MYIYICVGEKSNFSNTYSRVIMETYRINESERVDKILRYARIWLTGYSCTPYIPNIDNSSGRVKD